MQLVSGMESQVWLKVLSSRIPLIGPLNAGRHAEVRLPRAEVGLLRLLKDLESSSIEEDTRNCSGQDEMRGGQF